MSIGIFIQLTGFLWIEGVASSQKGFVYTALTAILLFIPAGILWATQKEALTDLRKNPYFLLALGYLILTLIAEIVAPHETDNSSTYRLASILYTLIYFVSITTFLYFYSSSLIKTISTSIVIISLFATASIINQYYILGTPTDEPLHCLGIGDYGCFYWKNAAAAYFSFFAAVLISSLIHSHKINTKNIISIILLIPLGAYVYYADSRGPQLGLSVTIAALSYFVFIHPLPIKIRLGVFASIALVVVVTLIFNNDIYNHFLSRGLNGREQIWIHTINKIFDGNFWFGTQERFYYQLDLYGHIQELYHAHSLFIHSWYEYGFINMTYLVILLVLSFMLAMQNPSLNKILALGILFTAITYYFFDADTPFSRFGRLLLWLPVGIIIVDHLKQAPKSKPTQ